MVLKDITHFSEVWKHFYHRQVQYIIHVSIREDTSRTEAAGSFTKKTSVCKETEVYLG